MPEARNWIEHPVALLFFSVFISAAFTGLVTGLINWGSINTTIKNNKENIDRSAKQWKDDLESERRVNEAWRVSFQKELDNLGKRLDRQEDRRADVQSNFMLAHLALADATVIPAVPPPIVPSAPQVLGKEIEALDFEIDRIESVKKFTELTDREQDDLRSLKVKRDIARMWQAWCSTNDPSRLSYCVDRFGEP